MQVRGSNGLPDTVRSSVSSCLLLRPEPAAPPDQRRLGVCGLARFEFLQGPGLISIGNHKEVSLAEIDAFEKKRLAGSLG
jgi:hypothetical protein